jgi:hypothetical protein
MSHYFLTQTAGCIVASAVDFIKSGQSIPGVEIEGPWGKHLACQKAYDKSIATIPRTVRLLNVLSLEERTSMLLNVFETDARYECARHLVQEAAIILPITLAVYIEKAWRDRITKNW